jgi:hypothetical protein
LNGFQVSATDCGAIFSEVCTTQNTKISMTVHFSPKSFDQQGLR